MKKIISYAILPIIGIALIGVGTASAHGWRAGGVSPDEIESHHSQMFEKNAALLGISTDEFKAYWTEGKTLKEVAEEKGINLDELKNRMMELKKMEMKSHLQILVEKGVITQAQAEKRLQTIENKVGLGFERGMRGGFGVKGFGWQNK